MSPALEKLFDEILTNAIDHKERDKDMNNVRISIEADGSIHVSNDGSSTITTHVWPGTEIPTPQVLFHELHAGSNLGEGTNKHRVGGRNGVGATITNLFSEWFEVHVDNAEEGTTYTQRFEKNGSIVGKPKLKKYKNKSARTSISFLPDYARLGMPPIPTDAVRALLVGRAVDAAACTSANVHVNGKKLSVRSLRQYALAFGGSSWEPTRHWHLRTATERPPSPWEAPRRRSPPTQHQREETTDSAELAVAHIRVVVTTGISPPVHACFVNGVRCGGTLQDAVHRQLASSLASVLLLVGVLETDTDACGGSTCPRLWWPVPLPELWLSVEGRARHSREQDGRGHPVVFDSGKANREAGLDSTRPDL